MKLSPSDITVGDRARKDVDTGIAELAKSIQTLGQLHAIGIDSDYNLIFGARLQEFADEIEVMTGEVSK